MENFNGWDINPNDAKNYIDICNKILEDDEVFSNFKTLPEYNVILEHVDFELGQEYFDYIQEVGEEINEYVKNGIQKIIVFEPLSKNFDILSQSLQNVNADIEGYQVALGSEKGTALMYLSSNDAQSSSILKPKEHLEHHPDVLFDGTENVEVNILDDYDIGKVNFINIDVQGYELEVFKGAKETLKKIDYIYCEVNRGELYEGNPMIEEIDSFLNDYGFERVETHWPETWYKWGDALYIKKLNH